MVGTTLWSTGNYFFERHCGAALETRLAAAARSAASILKWSYFIPICDIRYPGKQSFRVACWSGRDLRQEAVPDTIHVKGHCRDRVVACPRCLSELRFCVCVPTYSPTYLAYNSTHQRRNNKLQIGARTTEQTELTFTSHSPKA
eukprot:scaffold7750_cov86-Skeletonema_menzelii.AAC.1